MTISYEDLINHSEPIECSGCHEKFSLTVREDPLDNTVKYCANCFGHVIGLKNFEETWKSLSPLNQEMWEIPTNKLPIETLRQMKFIDTKRNVK